MLLQRFTKLDELAFEFGRQLNWSIRLGVTLQFLKFPGKPVTHVRAQFPSQPFDAMCGLLQDPQVITFTTGAELGEESRRVYFQTETYHLGDRRTIFMHAGEQCGRVETGQIGRLGRIHRPERLTDRALNQADLCDARQRADRADCIGGTDGYSPAAN